MPPSPKLVKPLKEAKKTWTKKDRLMVLALLLATILPAAFLSLRSQDYTLPSIAMFHFSSPFSSSSNQIIYELNPVTPTPTPTPPPALDEFHQLVQNLKGDYGFYVYRLNAKYEYGSNYERIFTAASLIKLPVLISLYQASENGTINLDEVYSLKPEDKVPGAGSLQSAPIGTQKTYRELAQAMAKSSDNTALRIITRKLGITTINQTVSQIGMVNTSYSDNTTTPKDIGLLFQKLYQNRLLKPENKNELIDFLTKTDWEDRIPAGIPQDIKVAHKIGTEAGVWSDAGIVFSSPPFILVIVTENALENEALAVIPQIAQAVYSTEQKTLIKP